MRDLKVLVVEDEVHIQLEIETALHGGGFYTDAATSAEDAILALQTGPVIALFTDINLRGSQTGWDVARYARELYPTLPIVYVTSTEASVWVSQGVQRASLSQAVCPCADHDRCVAAVK